MFYAIEIHQGTPRCVTETIASPGFLFCRPPESITRAIYGGHSSGRIDRVIAVGADMRITPNHPRLRLVALGCWALSGWCIIQGGRLVDARPGLSLMVVGV